MTNDDLTTDVQVPAPPQDQESAGAATLPTPPAEAQDEAPPAPALSTAQAELAAADDAEEALAEPQDAPPATEPQTGPATTEPQAMPPAAEAEGAPTPDVEVAPPPQPQAEGRMREYWKRVLTGDPATVPAAVRRKAGVEDWDAPEEQKSYRLLSVINKSWAADHLPSTREQIRSSWPRQRAELAQKYGVRDNEHELFLALSEEEKDAPRKEAANEIFTKAYMAGLDGRDVLNLNRWRDKLSDEDWANAQPLADMAYLQGQRKREEMRGLAERIANGLDAFAAVEEDTISAPRVFFAAPDLVRAIDELADLGEEDQNTAMYLAAGLVHSRNSGYTTPSLYSRTVQAVRRGATGIAAGALQAVANTGIATVNKIGERFDSEGLRSTAADWDKRMRMFQKLRNLSQQELRPLVLPHETNRAASYLITAAEATPSALLSCCGGAGFAALTLGAVGDSVAEARNRAPLASQELQLYAGLLGGAIQAGIYMNLNRVGGRLLEQSISRIGRSAGQGITGYTLAGLNVMSGATTEAAKMLAAGKLAQAADLGAQELAARLSHTASNINWQEFGDNLTDIETNMHEAAALLPYLLLGSGRLALHHFRSPRAILGEGKLLQDWGIPEQQQEAILAEPNPDLQSRMLREAITGSKLWGGAGFLPSAWRALRLLHSDSFQEFRNIEQVHDFLKLPAPPPEELPALTARAQRRLPHNPEQKGLNPRMADAMRLWNEWWQRAHMNQVPAPYPDAGIFGGTEKQAPLLSMRSYDALSYMNMDTQLPRRMRELSIYAPHAAAEREIMLRDRVKHLEALSYQFIMGVYSVDSLKTSGEGMRVWRSRTERTRRSMLGAVARSIITTARGVDRMEAFDELNNYIKNFYLRRKYRGFSSKWITSSNAGSLAHLPESAGAYFISTPEVTPEMLQAFRLVSGLRSCADALIDLLPYTNDFQTALSRGLSPTAAYTNILTRELALTEKEIDLKKIKLGADFENVTPMHRYTAENADAFKIYSQLTGYGIERSLGEDSTPYSRTRRPNGSLTHWHLQDEHAVNDVAGNAALLFLPFGSYRGNISELYSQGDNTINLLNRPTAGQKDYTGYDQLCSVARYELSRLWLENLTQAQPGLHMERMHRYLRNRQLRDAAAPHVVQDADRVDRYKVDDISQATPLSMAQGRFYVYWQRMLNSGFVTPEEIGDYLVASGAMTATERKAILSPPYPVVRNWRKERKHPRGDAQKARLAGIPRNMAEKMADYTTLRFLAGMKGLPLPNSVKEWVGMAAFCPESYAADSGERGKLLSLRDGGVDLTGWANRAAARKLRELAPQVEKVRKRLQSSQDADPLFEALFADAMGLEKSLRYEQGWCYHTSGTKAVFGAPQSYWNMLRFPRRTWDRMSEEERAPYRERLAPLCNHEPAFTDPERPANDPVEAAIYMLDDLLREYPQMHRYSMEDKRLDRIRMITLDGRYRGRDPMKEPFYEPLPVYQWRGKMQKGFKVNSTSIYLPEFFTTDRRTELGLTLLDELRAFRRNLPHAFRDGIWWQGELYGLGGKSPMRPGEYYAERPLEPLINLLQSISRYEELHGPIKVCGTRLRGLEPNLNLRPLEAITIYRSKADRRMMYRLMPGDVALGKSPMSLPYLVHCRAGIYLNDRAAIRTAEGMPNIFVPLHRFFPQAKRTYKTHRETWLKNSWQFNLEQALQRCADAEAPANELAHYNDMLEYLMRLAEDSGFSPSLAEVDPQTLSLGQARLLNLVRDMVASLCSNSPESAYQSLVSQVQSLTPRKTAELLRVLRHSNESIPGVNMGSLLEMEDIFADELDRAVHEREAELEAEGETHRNLPTSQKKTTHPTT